MDDSPQVQVQYEPTELLDFLARDLVQMNAMCERAQMFECLIFERTKAVFEYFGLPFDAPPLTQE